EDGRGGGGRGRLGGGGGEPTGQPWRAGQRPGSPCDRASGWCAFGCRPGATRRSVTLRVTPPRTLGIFANTVTSNPTDHFYNVGSRHNLGFVLKTPQDFGRLY